MSITEGYMPFLGYRTYYRIVGKPSASRPPLLLLHGGSEDLCTPAVARSMHDGIPGSRWELMEGARHMCFVDRHEDYCRILASWLEEHDPM